MSWLENLILGLVSGLTEFLPISASAHQMLLLKLFGVTQVSRPLFFAIHGGLFTGLVFYSMSDLIRIRREMRLARVPMRKRKRQPDMRIVLERRLMGCGALLSLLGGFASGFLMDSTPMLSIISIMLLINGAALFVPSLYSAGNKDSRHLSPAEGWLFGLCAGVGMLPGLSRMALVASSASLRGAEGQSAFRYGVLLGLPSLAGLLAADLYLLVSQGIGTLSAGIIFGMVCAFAAAVIGTYISLSVIKRIAVRRPGTGFSYYCWGAALLALILHLSVS